MFRGRRGRRTSKYPFCAKPECRRRASAARVYAFRARRRSEPLDLDALRLTEDDLGALFSHT